MSLNLNVKKVLKGHFPKQALEKMNRKCLEKFVLELVECSSSKCGTTSTEAKDFQGLYRGLCLRQINTPEWWPSEQIISQSLTSDGKCFMEILRFLVYKCCQFFKKGQSLNKATVVNVNKSENKRVVSTHKRRTLLPQNLTAKTRSASPIVIINCSPVVSLTDIQLQKPVTQEGFLNGFGLQKTFSPVVDEEPTITSNSSSIKFNNSSHIPFSSDLGRELMRRDNHLCPEALKTRRLERLEWYVNKPINRASNTNYEVTYQEKKDLQFLDRKFKYPKRQIWQHGGDVDFQKKALLCRRLDVVVVRQDLSKLQRKLRVELRKLPRKDVGKPKAAAVAVRRTSVRALRSRNRCGSCCC